jgi:hypothetical protein
MNRHEYKRQNEQREARIQAKKLEKSNAEKRWFQRRPKWWSVPSDRFSFFVAAFTGLLATVSIWQLLVIRGQLDAMERDQQPYLSIGDKVIQPRIDNGRIIWAWNVTNFGKGEAKDVSVDAFLRIGVNGLFERSPKQPGPGWMGDIAAGRTNNGLVSTDPIYSSGDFDNLNETNFAFGLLLKIQYFGLNKEKFRRSICISRFSGGGMGIDDPQRCESQKKE